MNWLYLSSIISLMIVLPSYIQANNPINQLDSILEIVDNVEGKKKLEMLEECTFLHQNNVLLAKELEKEAIKQGNDLYVAIANQRLVYHFAVEGKRDSMKFYLNRIEEHLTLFYEERASDYNSWSEEEKEKYSKSKNVLLATRATIHIDEGKYNLALTNIKKALEDPIIGKSNNFKSQAYSLIGIAYLYTKKPKEALENFRKTLRIKEKLEADDIYVGQYTYYSALEGSTIAYIMMRKYQEAVLLADSLSQKLEEEYKHRKILQGENTDDEFKYNFLSKRILCYSAEAHIRLNHKEIARQQLDEVKQFVSEISLDKIHQDFHIYYLMEVEYYLLLGDYDKAKEYAILLVKDTSFENQTYSYLQSNLILSRVLNEEGKSKEAYDLLYNLYNSNDSINAINFSNEFAEMETKHELNEAKFLINEANLKLKNTQMILLVFVVFFLLSILVVYTIWRNKKILKDKNTSLYKQYKEIESRNKKITELQSTHRSMVVNDNYKEDANGEIMERLAQYLTETKVYLNPEVNREDVALAIGTNRQYLIEAIKEKTGKTFNEFIYSYRLKFAYELLTNNREQTISDVLQESGFHSRATFYTAFKDAYGMTPSELRSILK